MLWTHKPDIKQDLQDFPVGLRTADLSLWTYGTSTSTTNFLGAK